MLRLDSHINFEFVIIDSLDAIQAVQCLSRVYVLFQRKCLNQLVLEKWMSYSIVFVEHYRELVALSW